MIKISKAKSRRQLGSLPLKQKKELRQHLIALPFKQKKELRRQLFAKDHEHFMQKKLRHIAFLLQTKWKEVQ